LIRAAHPTLLRSGYGGGASAGNAYCLAETRRVCWDDAAPEPIAVVLADDHEIVGNGIRMSVPGTPSLEILPRIAAAYMNPRSPSGACSASARSPPFRLAPQCRLSGGFLSIRSDYLGGRVASADACGAAPP